jgi:hypothetical protein
LVLGSFAAVSTASEIAIPSEPGESGFSARIAFPESVSLDGDGITRAPHVSIITRRPGFWSYDAFTMYTWHFKPKNAHAIAIALPHCPAPVSVAIRFVFSALL